MPCSAAYSAAPQRKAEEVVCVPLRLRTWRSARCTNRHAGRPCALPALAPPSRQPRNARRFNFPVLDFDQFMSYVKSTGATPYLVLNYDSANLIYGSGDWSYSQLLALAQSWLQYIVRMGYQVLPGSSATGWQVLRRLRAVQPPRRCRPGKAACMLASRHAVATCRS